MAINIEAGTKEYSVRTDFQSDLATHALYELVRTGHASQELVNEIVEDRAKYLSAEIYLGRFARSHGVSFDIAREQMTKATILIKSALPRVLVPNTLGARLRRIING